MIRCHSGPPQYSCEKCKKTFVTEERYKQHCEKCVIMCCDFEGCDYKTADKTSMTSHKKIHEKYKCEECKIDFLNYAQYKEHVFIYNN